MGHQRRVHVLKDTLGLTAKQVTYLIGRGPMGGQASPSPKSKRMRSLCEYAISLALLTWHGPGEPGQPGRNPRLFISLGEPKYGRSVHQDPSFPLSICVEKTELTLSHSLELLPSTDSRTGSIPWP